MIALAAAMLAADAAAAVPGGPPVERVGRWEVEAGRFGHCAARIGAHPGTRLSLGLTAGGTWSVSVVNRAWPRASERYRLFLVRGGERRELAAEDPRHLPGVGVSMELSEAAAREVVEAEAIEVVDGRGKTVERIETEGLSGAAARLPACLDIALAHPWPRLAAPPPPPPPPPRNQGKGRSAVPKTPLYRLITADDYPPAAYQAGEQGTVTFRLAIDREGRVSDCLIIGSSGSATLDSATCALMTARAVFEPARDAEGRRTPDRFLQRMVWRIEAPPPATPPPPAQ